MFSPSSPALIAFAASEKIYWEKSSHLGTFRGITLERITELLSVVYDIGYDIRHFRNEKRTGAESHPAIVSGIVAGDSMVSYCP